MEALKTLTIKSFVNGLKYAIDKPPKTNYHELECNFLLL